MTTEPAPPPRVVVVGGGAAGLELTTALARRRPRHGEPRLAVTLVDSDIAHVWKPMLHTIAAGTSDMSQQQTFYVAHARAAGFSFAAGALAGLDRSAREIAIAPVTSADGRLLIPARRIGYDLLVLAIGSEANDFGTPGVTEFCLRIDSRRQANAFYGELNLRMVQAATQGIPLPIAIVGGGATGVQLAAELIEVADLAEGYGAPGLRSRVSVTLIESGSRLLAAFPEKVAAAIQVRLEQRGIKVLLGAHVNAADPEGFGLADATRVPAAMRVWAAGVKAAGLLAGLDGLPVTRNHQLVVLPSLQSPVDTRVFAMGDCSSLTLPGAERPLPTTAQVAHQQAQHLAHHLPASLLHGDRIPDFAYRDFGSLISLGEYDGYGALGKFGIFKGLTLRGRLAQLSHLLLYRSHQARVHGFWRGGLLWLVDLVNARVKSRIRLG